MSTWISYDKFVDLVRNHHHEGFNGLITGVSSDKHSFQIGFLNGNVVLLNYRILKGKAALERLAQITQAKVTEHPAGDITDITIPQGDLPDTSSILSRLTTEIDDDVELGIADVRPPTANLAAAASDPSPDTSATLSIPDRNTLEFIKSSAIHYFGPIGAMVCEEHLSTSNLSSIDLNSLLHRITQDVGASDADTQAFLSSIP